MFQTPDISDCKSSQACKGLATGMALALLVALTAVSAFAGPVQTVLYQASAYGTSAFVGNTILVGQTGVASLQVPCGTNNDNETVDGSGVGEGRGQDSGKPLMRAHSASQPCTADGCNIK